MKHSILGLTICAMCFIVSCKSDKKETNIEDPMNEASTKEASDTKTMKEKPAYYADKKKVTLALESKSDSKATGNIVFTQEQGNVTMVAVLDGLSQGTHAIHIHETADCSAADGTSAGGHWNPTAQPHGKWGDAKGYHKGDIGNFDANEKGHGTVTLTTDEWCIGCGDDTKDILGKAIIVHQGTDDFTSQPSGAAGARVSCGGIIEK